MDTDDLSIIFDPKISTILLHALIEKAVLGKESAETINSVRALSPSIKVSVEVMILNATGQHSRTNLAVAGLSLYGDLNRLLKTT